MYAEFCLINFIPSVFVLVLQKSNLIAQINFKYLTYEAVLKYRLAMMQVGSNHYK